MSDLKITKVDLRPSNYSVAYGSVQFNGALWVNIEIKRTKSGELFVSWPARKVQRTGEWIKTVRITPKEMNNRIHDEIISAWVNGDRENNERRNTQEKSYSAPSESEPELPDYDQIANMPW